MADKTSVIFIMVENGTICESLLKTGISRCVFLEICRD